jgi:hypothetical protein
LLYFLQAKEEETFDNPRLVQLFELLAKGETPEIAPVLSARSPLFCRYPLAESALGLSAAQTHQLLSDLVRNGYLKRRFHDRIALCPACNERDLRCLTLCPKCGSRHILKPKVFEHLACGTVGTEADYTRNGTNVCPKCRLELQLLGSDYRMLEGYSKCQDCGELTDRPVTKWRCEKCQSEMDQGELHELCLYSLRLNEVQSYRLRSLSIPRTQIETILTREGYEIQREAKILGRSGAVAEIDLLATRNDNSVEHRVVIGFATAEETVDSEEVIRLYAKANDVNAQEVILIALPALSEDARQFAQHCHIRVLDDSDLNQLEAKLLVS